LSLPRNAKCLYLLETCLLLEIDRHVR
jgi:hypothetical protein